MVGRARFVVVIAALALVVGGAAACSQVAASGSAPGTFLLPWASGSTHSVLQGVYETDGHEGCVSGCVTHQGAGLRFSWDFDLPEGTPVLASRAGKVALVQGSWSSDHCGTLPGGGPGRAGTVSDPLIGNQANFVQIDHGDGTSALYLHLAVVDAAIEAAARNHDMVDQGQVLGLSGKTGLTNCVPHLHFQVQPTVRADWFTDSLPVHFVDGGVVVRSPDGVPVEGESYVSDNQPS